MDSIICMEEPASALDSSSDEHNSNMKLGSLVDEVAHSMSVDRPTGTSDETQIVGQMATGHETSCNAAATFVTSEAGTSMAVSDTVSNSNSETQEIIDSHQDHLESELRSEDVRIVSSPGMKNGAGLEKDVHRLDEVDLNLNNKVARIDNNQPEVQQSSQEVETIVRRIDDIGPEVKYGIRSEYEDDIGLETQNVGSEIDKTIPEVDANVVPDVGSNVDSQMYENIGSGAVFSADIENISRKVDNICPDVDNTAPEIRNVQPEVNNTASKLDNSCPEIDRPSLETVDSGGNVEDLSRHDNNVGSGGYDIGREVHFSSEVNVTFPEDGKTCPSIVSSIQEIDNHGTELFSDISNPEGDNTEIGIKGPKSGNTGPEVDNSAGSPGVENSGPDKADIVDMESDSPDVANVAKKSSNSLEIANDEPEKGATVPKLSDEDHKMRMKGAEVGQGTQLKIGVGLNDGLEKKRDVDFAKEFSTVHNVPKPTSGENVIPISSPNSRDGDHDSGVDESTQRKEESPTKSEDVVVGGKSPMMSESNSKTSSMTSKTTTTTTTKKTIVSPPTASPARVSAVKSSTPASSIKSVTPTPEKKLPMNKVVVGTSAAPNLTVVKSKIGSLQNVKHKAGGGEVKVETKKIDLSTVKSKVGSTDNMQHKPQGGERKVVTRKLEWKAQSKIGSLENAGHKAGGGDKKIESQKLDFKEKAKSKVGSKDNIEHKAGGGAVQIEERKLTFKESAKPKIGSLDNVTHKPGGGTVQIFDEKTYYRQTSSSSKKSSVTSSNGHLSENQPQSPQPSPNSATSSDVLGEVHISTEQRSTPISFDQ